MTTSPSRSAPLAPRPATPAAAEPEKTLPPPKPVEPPRQPDVIQPTENVVIPGPLRSFERMAGISQQVAAPDLLSMVARKAYREGYVQGRPSEFLLLIQRYLQQARELAALAPTGVIRVNNCEDAGALIRVLGYRLRPNCGQPSFSLETDNPTRAFLTIDSGFPLVDLEEALQTGKPFIYPYAATAVPVMFRAQDWISLRSNARLSGSGDLIDVLLGDPQVARLYYAISMQDTATRIFLTMNPGLRALLANAAALDFYGGNLVVRSGRVNVPGGASAQGAWRDLVGVSPDNAAKFVDALLGRDQGWMAAFYDVMTRLSPAQQQEFTEAGRLKRIYDAYKGTSTLHSAYIGVFRNNADLLVLLSRVSWEADGTPHVPGDLGAWKDILRDKDYNKIVHTLARKAQGWSRPEQLLEGMAALAHDDTDMGPVQIFLVASEIDRQRHGRPPLSAATVRDIAAHFAQFSTWYQIFSEFPALDDASITRFGEVANTIDQIKARVLRGNAEGSFQAALGLWQILARQGQIPEGQANDSWLKVVNSFATVTSPTQLFDATRASMGTLLTAAGAPPNATEADIINLLAGPRQTSPEAERIRGELAGRMHAVLDDQRLVSLDTLFNLYDGLKDPANASVNSDKLLTLAAELREFDLPRPIFTNSEKVSWAPAIYTDHHAELQVRTDLSKVIKGPSTPAQLETARGLLTPFLRDTLVGLNYAYYEPADAQMLHHNPLFVRSHDFLGVSVTGAQGLWGEPHVLGAGTPAGGGAYLMGSLSDLSYALAATEEDFIAPKNIQALIVKELAPVLMVSGTIPRWWKVTPDELHAAALYQSSGEELLTSAAGDESLRDKVVNVLEERLEPRRVEAVRRALASHDINAARAQVTPAESLYLAVHFRSAHPEIAVSSWGPSAQKLADLQAQHPQETSLERISRDFGVPHPTFAQTGAFELMNVKPLPFFGSYSSRLYAESWESNNLYWARLADEMGYTPAALNTLVPGLTRRMISNIFATDIEDWPAVLRALRQTGDEFRQGKIAGMPPPDSPAHLSSVAAVGSSPAVNATSSPGVAP
jgi:hypothetical protein